MKNALTLCILIITCTIAHYPQSNFLRQNYPNPFSSETSIRFFWGDNEDKKNSSSETILLIYNSIGQEVFRNEFGNMDASGGHALYFNASDLPNGVYFCSLRWGSYVETIKMIKLQ